MSGDERPAMRMSALFDPEPQTWGLRGDPYLWQALRTRLAGQEVPASADELADLLHAAFCELVGIDLASDPAPAVYRDQYAHGGMSSGMISLGTWRQRLMPCSPTGQGQSCPAGRSRRTQMTRCPET